MDLTYIILYSINSIIMFLAIQCNLNCFLDAIIVLVIPIALLFTPCAHDPLEATAYDKIIKSILYINSNSVSL